MATEDNKKPTHVSHIPSKHKVMFVQVDNKTKRPSLQVEAHLPENFAIGIGGEVSTPFSSFITDNTVTNLFKLGGTTFKTGFFTRKVYVGPETPDITFEVKFDTFYNAYDEVIVPVEKLMAFAAGIDKSVLSLGYNQDEEGNINVFTETTNEHSQRIDVGSYLNEPPICRVKIGDFIILPNGFITGVEPRFSNIMDSNGYPISADVSVTISLIEPLTAKHIIGSERIFNHNPHIPFKG